MNRELQEQLARAFGLGSDADVDALITALRDGGPVDAQILRRGCLALVDTVQEVRAAHDESAARLKLALEASNLGLWDADLTAGTVFFDRTLCKFLGRPEQDRLWPVDELIERVHPEDRAGFQAALRAALRGDVPTFHTTHRVRHDAGHWLWLETFGKVTRRNAEGRATRITGTHADISERRRMELTIASNLRVLQALLETLPLPVIMRDAERRVTMVNAAWENMLGIPREEVVGQLMEANPTLVRNLNHRETDDAVVETRQPLRYETAIHTRDGQVYNVIVAKTPLLDGDGALTGIAAVVTDISEQKRTAAALERARLSAEAAVQAKSRFLANMSHELRTPLNGVVGMASLLANTPLADKQRRFVQTLKSSAESLATLIDDVLDLSKAEAGKLELAHVPFDLRKELEQVVTLFGARAYDKGIDIAAHIARGVPAIMHGDPIRMRQILGNLVNNAVKFTEAGAVLLGVQAVAGTGDDFQLEFSVSDTGVGVPETEQQRIFEAFEQADGSVTRKFGGTGLGLAISRQLVDLMRGTLGLESQVGRGSRFYFRIAAGVPRPVPGNVIPAADTGALVIGMHPIVRSAICDTISTECAHVISAHSAVLAIETLGDFGPAIRHIRVIIDSGAIDLNAAVNALRIAAAPRPIEVVAVMPPDADAKPPAGVSRCIVKPLITPDLMAPLVPNETTATLRAYALPPSGSRGRALVVEDNAVNQEMARAMLDMLGFQVATAANGREGVTAAAADANIAIILMDCQMPVMDGLSAAREIRATETSGHRVPIVALTGNAMPGDREACVAAGMDDYLAKPFSLSALRAMVDKWTGGGKSVSADTSPTRRQRS